jgi:hypothetical protein
MTMNADWQTNAFVFLNRVHHIRQQCSPHGNMQNNASDIRGHGIYARCTTTTMPTSQYKNPSDPPSRIASDACEDATSIASNDERHSADDSDSDSDSSEHSESESESESESPLEQEKPDADEANTEKDKFAKELESVLERTTDPHDGTDECVPPATKYSPRIHRELLLAWEKIKLLRLLAELLAPGAPQRNEAVSLLCRELVVKSLARVQLCDDNTNSTTLSPMMGYRLELEAEKIRIVAAWADLVQFGDIRTVVAPTLELSLP